MKRLLLTLALLAPATTAGAGNPTEALGYAASLVYNDKCETLPEDFVAWITFGISKQSAEDLANALKTAQGVLDKVGQQEFCARSKPIIAKHKAKLQELMSK